MKKSGEEVDLFFFFLFFLSIYSRMFAYAYFMY